MAPTSRSLAARLLAAVPLVWSGLVVGISFIEAPVKFTAPSLTLAVGVDVGRHVFAALNRAEWVLVVVALAAAALAHRRPTSVLVPLAVAGAILAVQTAWLLPALDARAGVVVAGGAPPDSPLHLVFVCAEALKLAALLAAGWSGTRPLVQADPAAPVQPPASAGDDHPVAPPPNTPPSTGERAPLALVTLHTPHPS